MRLTSWSLASAVFAGDAVKSSGESPMVALEMNDVESTIGNPDQIIEDQLYWRCRDNKSLSSCVNDVVRTLNLYTLGDFACAITNKWPAYSWKTYEGWNEQCNLYMNCGNDGKGASPNWNGFDNACMAASYACGSNYSCARDYIVRMHNNGQFKWCPNRFNVLINPNPGAAAFKSPSGGSQVAVGSIYCTGFCVT